MTAETASPHDTCGSCGAKFSTGETKYLTRSRLTRCQACAERLVSVLPTLDVARRPGSVAPLDLSRFDRFAVGASVRGNILDYKRKQAGES